MLKVYGVMLWDGRFDDSYLWSYYGVERLWQRSSLQNPIRRFEWYFNDVCVYEFQFGLSLGFCTQCEESTFARLYWQRVIFGRDVIVFIYFGLFTGCRAHTTTLGSERFAVAI